MRGETLFRTHSTTGQKGALIGLCMECALRLHDFHELVGSDTRNDGPGEAALPQALIDGRRHVLLSHAWTHQERCSECKREAANLYLPIT
jgi:hypothetical protein